MPQTLDEMARLMAELEARKGGMDMAPPSPPGGMGPPGVDEEMMRRAGGPVPMQMMPLQQPAGGGYMGGGPMMDMPPPPSPYTPEGMADPYVQQLIAGGQQAIGAGSNIDLLDPSGAPAGSFDLADPSQAADLDAISKMFPPMPTPPDMVNIGGGVSTNAPGQVSVVDESAPQAMGPTRGQKMGRRAANRTLSGLDKLGL